MAATLRDVAKKANVSISTVSRILNKKTTAIPISEETRQRVLQAVQEVGYKPNIAARNLVRQQSFSLIGVIVPLNVPSVLTHPFYMTLVHGIANYCQEYGYAVTIYFVDTNSTDPAEVEQIYNRILDIPADGFILTSTHQQDQFIPRFLADNVTFVHIGRRLAPPSPPTCYIDLDNYAGARLAVDYLLRQGHQKIATITGPMGMSAGVDRLRGYQEAVAAAGLSIEPAWVMPGDFSTETGYQLMKTLLMGDAPQPTAVFAASDATAIGVIQAVQEQGLTVPDDIAVVGFDDIQAATLTTPPITTIRQPIFTLGEKASELLLGLVNQTASQTHLILSPELIVRESG